MSTYDLCVFGGVVLNQPYQSAISLFNGANGEACTGIVKLTQRWLLEFLTETGSQVNRPTRGCDFLTNFWAGSLATESAVDTEFRFSETTIINNLAADTTSTTPLDEILASATLDSITIQPGNLQLGITITSQAGNSRRVYVPVGVVDITGG